MATERPHAGDAYAVLTAAHRGDFMDELDDELREVVDAVRESGKKGKVVLTIAVETAKPGSDILSFDVTSKATVPKADRLSTVFYDSQGRLAREDPRQIKMDLRSVEDRPERPLREAD